MSEAERAKQGGSAIAYIIVGVVLVIGLVGSIYFVRQRGEIARKEQAIAAYEEQQKSDQVPDVDNDSTDSESNEDDEEIAVNDVVIDNEAEESSDLPQTGPGDTVLNVIILFILTSSVASYVLSLRHGL